MFFNLSARIKSNVCILIFRRNGTILLAHPINTIKCDFFKLENVHNSLEYFQIFIENLHNKIQFLKVDRGQSAAENINLKLNNIFVYNFIIFLINIREELKKKKKIKNVYLRPILYYKNSFNK